MARDNEWMIQFCNWDTIQMYISDEMETFDEEHVIYKFSKMRLLDNKLHCQSDLLASGCYCLTDIGTDSVNTVLCYF